MQKTGKSSEKHLISEFLMRLNLWANGFRAEIVVLRPEGVYTYTERKETAIMIVRCRKDRIVFSQLRIQLCKKPY